MNIEKQPCEPMVGADVEFFIAGNDTRKLVPCVGIIPGTKEKPWSGKGWTKGYALQEDNVMIEVNIPPQTTSIGFSGAMESIKTHATNELQSRIPHNITKKPVLSNKVVGRFTTSQLDSPQAQLFGCDPDYDAHSGGEMRMPLEASSNLRSCGGHIHIGGDFQCPDFVAALFADLIIGIYYRVTDQQPNKRQQFYGAPGIYRPKPYGIEYRTPSNKWAQTSDQMYNAGCGGIQTARYLTSADPTDIHTAFKRINWTDVRRQIIRPNNTRRNDLIDTAMKLGVIK